MRKVLFLTVVLAFAFASVAGAADVSGNWTLKMKNPMGEDEAFTLAIAAKGEALIITCNDHPKLTNLEGAGTLKGDAITMNLKATGDMAVEFTFTGTVEGNKMTGTREIGMAAGGGERGAPPEGAAPPEGMAPPEGESAESAESAESGAPGEAPAEVSNVFTAEKI